MVDENISLATPQASASKRKLCVPMLPSETIHIETACLMAGRTDETIRGWYKDDGIGRQAARKSGSRLQISAPALLMRAEGDLETLERFRNGERDHPDVQHFLRKAIVWLEAVRKDKNLAKPTGR